MTSEVIAVVGATGAYSGPSRPPIPFERDRLFRVIVTAHSVLS